MGPPTAHHPRAEDFGVNEPALVSHSPKAVSSPGDGEGTRRREETGTCRSHCRHASSAPLGVYRSTKPPTATNQRWQTPSQACPSSLSYPFGAAHQSISRPRPRHSLPLDGLQKEKGECSGPRTYRHNPPQHGPAPTTLERSHAP